MIANNLVMFSFRSLIKILVGDCFNKMVRFIPCFIMHQPCWVSAMLLSSLTLIVRNLALELYNKYQRIVCDVHGVYCNGLQYCTVLTTEVRECTVLTTEV